MASGPTNSVRTAIAAKHAGWTVLACWGGFWLWFYLGPMISQLHGQPRPVWAELAQQLATPLAIILITLLAVKFELVAGILLVLFGEASTLIITYGAAVNYKLLLALPLPALVAGALFLTYSLTQAAALRARRLEQREQIRTLSSEIPRGRTR